MFGVGVNMQFWCTSNFIFFGALVESQGGSFDHGGRGGRGGRFSGSS